MAAATYAIPHQQPTNQLSSGIASSVVTVGVCGADTPAGGRDINLSLMGPMMPPIAILQHACRNE
eukprot:scaffold557799_cov25-Prasinocladus_malaysianus.AAC.1